MVATDDAALVDDCRAALQSLAHDDVLTLWDTYPEERRLYLDYEALAAWCAEHDASLVGDLLRDPEYVQECFAEALRTYPAFEGPGMATAHVSVRNLPDAETFIVGEFSPTERLGRFTELRGQITKRTEVNPKLEEGAFRCFTCGTLNYVPQRPFGKIREPNRCESQGCDNSSFFRLVTEQSEWVDYQKVRLQQPPEAAHGDTEYLDIHLQDDLAGDPAVESGQRTSFTGELTEVFTGNVVFDKTFLGKGFTPEDTSVDDDLLEEYADVLDALASRDDTFEVLVNSLAPDHQGNWMEKAAVVLQIIGGWRRESPNGGYHRGDSHVYLLGDPGVGKTNLLRAAHEVAPLAVKTDGTGSSSAGLTAAIEKDDFSGEQWSIAAGTIVRGNGGLACVDELDKGDTDDLDALHTALETQEVHVDKAGKNARLPARTALLAAGNPTGGHFDPTEEIADQVNLKSPLLSRFDLIYTMRSKESAEEVRPVARKIVEARTVAGRLEREEDVDPEELLEVEAELEPAEFKAFVTKAQEYKPIIRDPAVKDRLIEWFVELKTSLPQRYQTAMGDVDEYDGPPLPITARKLIAVIRLAEAAARIRFSKTVEMEDVELVIPFVERSLADIGIAPSTNAAAGTVDDSITAEDLGV